MKVYKILGIIIIVLLFQSCGDDVFIKTKVFADGSILREMRVENKKGELDSNWFPVPIDSTWTIEVEDTLHIQLKDTVLKHHYTIKKIFKNVEALNEHYSQFSDSLLFNEVVEYQKKFRWFYTFHNYTTTYKSVFKRNSIFEYLSESDLEFSNANWKKKKSMYPKLDSLQLASKDDSLSVLYDNWLGAVVSEELVEVLKKASIQMKKRGFTVADIENRKEIWNVGFEDLEKLYEKLDSIYNVDGLTTLLEKGEFEPYNRFSKKVECIANEDNLICGLELPGKIISTNGLLISDNATEWNIDVNYFFGSDYILKAESRVWNIWITFFSVLFILISMYLVRKKIKVI